MMITGDLFKPVHLRQPLYSSYLFEMMLKKTVIIFISCLVVLLICAFIHWNTAKGKGLFTVTIMHLYAKCFKVSYTFTIKICKTAFQ